MNSKGRPRKEGLDKVIKVTVSDEVSNMLDNTVKETGKSKSDILRDLIPIVSSKDFEGLLPNTGLEILQSYSEQCWSMLHTPSCIFETENLSDKMPAIIIKSLSVQPLICVKYPTFNIQIFDGIDPTKDTSHIEIENLIKDVQPRSLVHKTQIDYLVVGNSMVEMPFPFVSGVTCLSVILEDNIRSKNKIVEILKGNNYNVSVYPTYCLRKAEIELLENDKYFKVINNIS